MHITKLFDLTGQVALVTGGYGIYGFPISEALAEAGAHVVIAARGESRCREAASTMEEPSKEGHWTAIEREALSEVVEQGS